MHLSPDIFDVAAVLRHSWQARCLPGRRQPLEGCFPPVGLQPGSLLGRNRTIARAVNTRLIEPRFDFCISLCKASHRFKSLAQSTPRSLDFNSAIFRIALNIYARISRGSLLSCLRLLESYRTPHARKSRLSCGVIPHHSRSEVKVSLLSLSPDLHPMLTSRISSPPCLSEEKSLQQITHSQRSGSTNNVRASSDR